MIEAEEAMMKIINLIDSKTLLGAAYDCMSEPKKELFKKALVEIIQNAMHAVR